jgi:hypothetical protein
VRRYPGADEASDDLGQLLMRYQALPVGHPERDDLDMRIEDAERRQYDFTPDDTIGDLFDGFDEPPPTDLWCVDTPAIVQDGRPRRAA